MFLLEHDVLAADDRAANGQRIISKRMQFVLMDKEGNVKEGGNAPYLDYEEPSQEEKEKIGKLISNGVFSKNWEEDVLVYATRRIVPEHLSEVKNRIEKQAEITLKEVRLRLSSQINYWVHRSNQLELDVKAGKQPRMQPENARRTADDLKARLEKREKELEAMKMINSGTPIITGYALVIPQGWVDREMGKDIPAWAADAASRAKIEKLAMDAVIQREREKGYEPVDVSAQNLGWDITSKGKQGNVRFLEVKGRVSGASTVTITRNEICAGLNQKNNYYLAIAQIDNDKVKSVNYIPSPFESEPGFGVASLNYDLNALLSNTIKD